MYTNSVRDIAHNDTIIDILEDRTTQFLLEKKLSNIWLRFFEYSKTCFLRPHIKFRCKMAVNDKDHTKWYLAGKN